MTLVSFCISTYKRPEILRNQLQLLAQQTYSDFEVVISDNDPDESARDVVKSLNDKRFRYYANEVNFGIIKSFNKSIERANTEYIVMITDDDPLDINFLSEMIPLIYDYPGKSLYCGFIRNQTDPNRIELIDKDHFPYEVLHPIKNPSIFWSNCILKKNDVLKIGLIPDYGSPHLSDHALLALTGSINGGVVKNKIYSSHFLHDDNYSRGNFETYYTGCIGFYKLLSSYFKTHVNSSEIERTIRLHLKNWFIIMSSSLRRYFYKQHDIDKSNAIEDFSRRILSLPFMKDAILKFKLKKLIFQIKAFLRLL